MKKTVMFSVLFLSILLVASFTLAQDTTEDEEEDATQALVDAAYTCLEDSLGSGCADLTNPEALSYAILALGDQQCADKLLESSDKGEEECWPSGSCKVKDTAIAMIALDQLNKDTTKIKAWLLTQTQVAKSLIWYIEIDADEATTCDVTRGTSTKQITINEDKTISSFSDTCLSLSTGNYWLQLNSNCLEEEFTISCDKAFKSTLLYQSQSSSTIYVSQSVHGADANGITTEQVTFECFQQGTSCNYESSLWASLALRKDGESIVNYLPYLKAFASENRGDFPEAFLHILTGNPEYLSSTISDNFKGNFWQVGTQNKEYNSAIAFMSLGDSAVNEVVKSKNYFLNNQDSEGCWNNPTDTARLLYMGWPKTISSSGGGGTGGGGTTEINDNCYTNNGFCIPLSKCAAINELTAYNCKVPSTVCCSQDEVLETCAQENGEICDGETQECLNDYYIDSTDAPNFCCYSSCELKSTGGTDPPIIAPLCTDNDGTCRNNCGTSEERDFALSCGENSGQICCVEEPGSLIWVWVLLILIVLVIVLILLRNKIKLLFFRVKSKFKKKPTTKERPAMLSPPGHLPPSGFRPPAHHRPPIRMPPQRPISRSQPPKDQDFDDTLKKLREMSK